MLRGVAWALAAGLLAAFLAGLLEQLGVCPVFSALIGARPFEFSEEFRRALAERGGAAGRSG